MTVNPLYMITFLENCVKANKNTPEEMCDFASNQIKEIDLKIKEIEKLRSEKSNLNSIIKQFSKNKPKNSFRYDWSTPRESLTNRELSLFIKICEYIGVTPGATPSAIISEVASLEIQDEVYNAIKWLAYNNIIVKKGKKNFYPGLKWDERPVFTADEKDQQEETRQAS